MYEKTNASPAPAAPVESTNSAPRQRPQPPSHGPRCGYCGGATVRAGTCYVCLACGTTTGCS